MLAHSTLSVTGGSPPTIKKREKGKTVEGRMRSSSPCLHNVGRGPGTLSCKTSSRANSFLYPHFFFSPSFLMAEQWSSIKVSYASETSEMCRDFYSVH